MPPTEKQAEKDKLQLVKDYERTLEFIPFEIENHFPQLISLPHHVNVMNVGALKRRDPKEESKKDKKSKNKLDTSFESRIDASVSNISMLGQSADANKMSI
mmetsp:Transcript_30930/g.28120  ORF Transcript_30930/g.28120 Transcript_30930/m.28120 type:complete len:101 (-) Transcript_30930:1045-1347(-)